MAKSGRQWHPNGYTRSWPATNCLQLPLPAGMACCEEVYLQEQKSYLRFTMKNWRQITELRGTAARAASQRDMIILAPCEPMHTSAGLQSPPSQQSHFPSLKPFVSAENCPPSCWTAEPCSSSLLQQCEIQHQAVPERTCSSATSSPKLSPFSL